MRSEVLWTLCGGSSAFAQRTAPRPDHFRTPRVAPRGVLDCRRARDVNRCARSRNSGGGATKVEAQHVIVRSTGKLVERQQKLQTSFAERLRVEPLDDGAAGLG